MCWEICRRLAACCTNATVPRRGCCTKATRGLSSRWRSQIATLCESTGYVAWSTLRSLEVRRLLTLYPRQALRRDLLDLIWLPRCPLAFDWLDPHRAARSRLDCQRSASRRELGPATLSVGMASHIRRLGARISRGCPACRTTSPAPSGHRDRHASAALSDRSGRLLQGSGLVRIIQSPIKTRSVSEANSFSHHRLRFGFAIAHSPRHSPRAVYNPGQRSINARLADWVHLRWR